MSIKYYISLVITLLQFNLLHSCQDNWNCGMWHSPCRIWRILVIMLWAIAGVYVGHIECQSIFLQAAEKHFSPNQTNALSWSYQKRNLNLAYYPWIILRSEIFTSSLRSSLFKSGLLSMESHSKSRVCKR